MTDLFYCEDCGITEDQDSAEGWDCTRCGDCMARFIPESLLLDAIEEFDRRAKTATHPEASSHLEAAIDYLRHLLPQEDRDGR